jgi:hypothetical protein
MNGSPLPTRKPWRAGASQCPDLSGERQTLISGRHVAFVICMHVCVCAHESDLQQRQGCQVGFIK